MRTSGTAERMRPVRRRVRRAVTYTSRGPPAGSLAAAPLLFDFGRGRAEFGILREDGDGADLLAALLEVREHLIEQRRKGPVVRSGAEEPLESPLGQRGRRRL